MDGSATARGSGWPAWPRLAAACARRRGWERGLSGCWLDPSSGARNRYPYSRTSIVARWVRDEVRQVGPGLWLGKVFMGRWRAIDFAVRAP